MRLLIVGSCQTVGLGDCIAAACPHFDVEVVEVWNKAPEQLLEVARQVESSEVLLMHPLRDPKYAVLREARDTRGSGLHNWTIHRLVFTGTAPDCRYIGAVGRRMASPVMNYHSGRVLECFLAGKTEADAVAALGGWSEAEVIESWNRSRSQFASREKIVDVPFMEELDASLASMHSFHVFNHPAIELLHAYAAKIIATLAPGTETSGALPPDRLERTGSFPVYEAVREYMGLPYGHPDFTVGSTAGPVAMELGEFVERSYTMYRAQPRELLVEAHRAPLGV